MISHTACCLDWHNQRQYEVVFGLWRVEIPLIFSHRVRKEVWRGHNLSMLPRSLCECLLLRKQTGFNCSKVNSTQLYLQVALQAEGTTTTSSLFVAWEAKLGAKYSPWWRAKTPHCQLVVEDIELFNLSSWVLKKRWRWHFTQHNYLNDLKCKCWSFLLSRNSCTVGFEIPADRNDWITKARSLQFTHFLTIYTFSNFFFLYIRKLDFTRRAVLRTTHTRAGRSSNWVQNGSFLQHLD